jgi:hypothetical protein
LKLPQLGEGEVPTFIPPGTTCPIIPLSKKKTEFYLILREYTHSARTSQEKHYATGAKHNWLMLLK